jgi:hypothetical protein
MRDLGVALALVLVIEGVLWGLAPHFARRMLEAAADLPEQALRLGGAIAVATGVLIVWALRG